MLSGLLIGIGMILPGVSGGVIAVILGIYEKIIFSINDFKNNKKESIKFLLPVIIGVLLGAVISANLLKYLFDKYFVESCYLFMGLVIGSIPFLIKEVNKKEKEKINYVVLVITLIVSLIFSLLSKSNLDFSSTLDGGFLSIIKLFITGVIFISGKVIPGISSSFMLMIIGMYSYFLEFLSNPVAAFTSKIFELIPIVIGMIVGGIFFVKLMALLLSKHYSITYSIIIGIVLGSLISIYPDKVTIIGIIVFIIGTLLSYKLSSLNKK